MIAFIITMCILFGLTSVVELCRLGKKKGDMSNVVNFVIHLAFVVWGVILITR